MAAPKPPGSAKRICAPEKERTAATHYAKIKLQLGVPTSAYGVEAKWSGDLGANFRRYDFWALLNQGEFVRVVLYDPHFTVYNAIFVETVYKESCLNQPWTVETEAWWVEAEKKLRLAKQEHALAGIDIRSWHNTSLIRISAMDFPTYLLSVCESSTEGFSFEGNVKEVIKQAAKGLDSVDFRGETNDSKFNRWWQMRLSPREFVSSLLEWSAPLNRTKTRWLVYPDGRKLIVAEQGAMDSRHRATYEHRPAGGLEGSSGELLNWQILSNNLLPVIADHATFGGTSAVSGVKLDPNVTPDHAKVSDSNTASKLNTNQSGRIGLLRPREPEAGGFCLTPIPEHSAGDLGVRYEDYAKGRILSSYLDLGSSLLCCKFRVLGHYIWSGSEGLGVDTIKIVMLTPRIEGKKQTEHFLHGSWIVYGFHHIITARGWFTDLYCYRLYQDAKAKLVGPK